MVTTTNLVSYWNLDESSTGAGAVTRNDSHGSNHLTDTNTTASATGKINDGADFETANNEVLSIDDATQSGLDVTGNLSISFWISYESLPASGVDRFFIGKFGGAGNRAYGVGIFNDAGVHKIEWLISSNGSTISSSLPVLSATPTLNQLYHYVIAYNTAGTTDFYVDNVALTQATGMHTSIFNNNQDFQIGGITGAATKHDGIIDEVGIWSRTLSSGDVSDLYNGGSGLAYPFTAATPPNRLTLLGVS